MKVPIYLVGYSKVSRPYYARRRFFLFYFNLAFSFPEGNPRAPVGQITITRLREGGKQRSASYATRPTLALILITIHGASSYNYSRRV